MTSNGNRAGIGRMLIAFHWLMLVLIVAAYLTIELKSIFPKGSASREAMATAHYMLGLSVFILVWLRLLARSRHPFPRPELTQPGWQLRLRNLVHCALYVLMIGVPLLGWITLGAKGTSIAVFGHHLPALVSKSAILAKWCKEMHQTVATFGYLLIGLHAAAALYHHFIKGDDTLRLMVYGFRRDAAP
jgi:cytochrome b561